MDLSIIIIIALSIVFTVVLVLTNNIFNFKYRQSINELLISGEPARMKRVAQSILAKKPMDCNAHYLLAKAYMATNKKNLALQEFMTINSLGQFTDICREIPFREELSSLYLNLGDFQAALKEFLLLTKLNPDNANYFYQVGNLLERQNKRNNAVTYYKKAIFIDANHMDALLGYGKIMYQSGNSYEAKKALMQTIELDNSNAQAHYFLGRLLRDAHSYTQSLSELDLAARSPEFRVPALLEKGLTLYKMNQHENAIRELERAIGDTPPEKNTPEIMNARYLLSLCYEHLREIDMALEQWEIIDKLNPIFRDVPDKLRQYQAIREDDLIKDFLTMSPQNFKKTCMSLTEKLGCSPVNYKTMGDGAEISAIRKDSGAWRRNRQQRCLFHILRTHDLVDRSAVSATYDVMRKMDIQNGIIICISIYTQNAQSFASSHSIELISVEQLRKMLGEINLQERKKH